MSTTLPLLWSGNAPVKLPPNAKEPKDVVFHAKQLTGRDRAQIISAFDSESYDMVASFVWTKAISSLRAQLAKLGSGFIGEMLDRPDIGEDSPVEQKLTEYETLRLAQDLGIIGGAGAFRLRQAFERIHFFGSLDPMEAETEGLTADEAFGVVRACVENVLGFERIEAALDFKRFRDSLTSEVLPESDPVLVRLSTSPYFFHRATIRILLALIKANTGAQLENALANANTMVPRIWPDLLQPEKIQIGRAYAETVNDGRSTAARGLKKLLLKVRGFDFVPEDLRSTAFLKAAHAVLAAHEGMNNFYNEPAPMRSLETMGSIIPLPAFPYCMSATLSVRLGNGYSFSWDAQSAASAVLRRTPKDRWLYYFNQCLPTDDRILYKLEMEKPVVRWLGVVQDYNLTEMLSEIANQKTKRLLKYASTPSGPKFSSAVAELIQSLGYAAKR